MKVILLDVDVALHLRDRVRSDGPERNTGPDDGATDGAAPVAGAEPC